MLNPVDKFLNNITMYRLLLWGLWVLIIIAGLLNLAGFLPSVPADGLFAETLELCLLCGLFNYLFAKFFNAPANVESCYITALILALIISPPVSPLDTGFLFTAVFVSLVAMASKYILAVRMKHVWNPAAIAVVLSAIAINQPASWWIGTAIMLPFTAIFGFLVVRKIRRADLVLSFFIIAGLITLGHDLAGGTVSLPSSVWRLLADTPLIFFATVMLTEPLTTPPSKNLRIIYGSLAGFLFPPFIHLGSVYSTPELALVVANIFSYAVSPKQKLMLTFTEKNKLANDTYEFVFDSDGKVNFKPGQYLEWTLPHKSPDSRGTRRYFTVASSPTEDKIRLGIRFYQGASSFKTELMNMPVGEMIAAGQLAGDFTLPNDKSIKLVFLAGGIGVTPFRSMIKYLVDTGENRDIVLLYSNKTAQDVAYKDLLDSAIQKIKLKIVYSNANETGMITEATIRENVPDFSDRMFYISGPNVMVTAFRSMLRKMGVAGRMIVTDYFPGF